MEQQEKQAIRSQRLRRAVTCMKRKEREGAEEEDGSEEEMPSPPKSKKGKTASKGPHKRSGEREEEKSAAGGGFLGAEIMIEPPLTSQNDVGCTSQESLSVKVPQSTKTLPQRAGRRSSSSSSGEDSDGGDEVAMVTARSVFEGSQRGRKTKSTRARGSTRGKGRGKK